MGPGRASGDAVLTAYATSLIRTKARQLSRRPPYRRSDEEDLAQDLTLLLLRKAPLFDPARGASLDTFAARVVVSGVKMLLRDRRRLKRAPGFTALLLEAGVMPRRGTPVPVAEVATTSDRERITLPAVHAEDAEAVAHAIDSLPPHLAEVARRLKDGGVASAARDLGLSRRKVYEAVAIIRERFRDAGLGG